MIEATRTLIQKNRLLDLEEWVQKGCLIPLSKHDQLPEYMKNEDGTPLFPGNLDPRESEDEWQDAIEIGWNVIEKVFGISNDNRHKKIQNMVDDDWQAFLKSVEKRKIERTQ